MALSDIEIRSARAEEKSIKLFDGGGLYLLVQPRMRIGGGDSNTASRAGSLQYRSVSILRFA